LFILKTQSICYGSGTSNGVNRHIGTGRKILGKEYLKASTIVLIFTLILKNLNQIPILIA